MAAKRPSRKQARRDALFVLYQREVTSLPVRTLLANIRLSEGYEADEFTVRLVEGVVSQQAELDAELERHSQQWRLARMAPLERNALRLALYEMTSGITPAEVAIDEAVRLIKRYASDEAGALVNGILAAALRERLGGDEDGSASDGRSQKDRPANDGHSGSNGHSTNASQDSDGRAGAVRE